MKNVLTIIKKEFNRFFKDRRMVITVLLPGLLIYALYSLMGTAMSDLGKVDEDYKPTVCVVNLPEILSEPFGAALELTEGTAEECKTKVEEGALDALVVFPENFTAELAEGRTPEVKVYYNSAKDNSYFAFSMVSGMLGAVNKTAFTVNSSQDKFDLANEKDMTAKITSMLVPMLMFALLSSACMAVAPESIAGEKERGTMATMLITPVNRVEIALGKIISLTCFAMLSGISSFLGVMFSLPKLMGGVITAETAALYSVGDWFMVLAVIISVVLVIISAFAVLSAYAKSVKEAGSIITPLMMVIILLGMVSMFFSSVPPLGLYAVPLLGSGLAMSSIMSFTITPAAIILSVLSNLVTAALLVVLLGFMFKSEKIMFKK